MVTKDEVIALHEAEPSLTASDIAERLGCHRAYVRATAYRNGLMLPHKNGAANNPKTLRATARCLIHRAEKLLERARQLESRHD